MNAWILAASALLTWDPMPQDVSYNVYVGIQSLRAGNHPVAVYGTTQTQYRVDGLQLGTKYFFCMTGVCPNLTETEYSNEVTYTPVVTTPTPPPVESKITIGETNVLTLFDNGNGNLLVTQQVALSQSAVIESISFYVTAAGGKLRLGIYDSTGPNGGPGNKIAETAEFTPIVGWNAAAVISRVTIQPGTYWLSYFPSSNALAFRKFMTGKAAYYPLSYGVMPDKFSTTPTTETVHWSLFATLTPIVATPVPTPIPTPTPTPTPNPTPNPTPTPTPAPLHTIDDVDGLRAELDDLQAQIDALKPQ